MKKIKPFLAIILSSSIFISGCASTSMKIDAAYVETTVYSDWECKKIKSEIRFLTDEVASLSGKQDEIQKKDQMYGVVGFFLLWPAWLFIKGDGQVAKDLANAKGKLKTLKRLSVDNDCE
tara:strand:- start:84 stop:443 length:360 start_codon:yes stop_codon:yes gene_type:complete